ncbi:MAG: hypothetical protein ABI213_14050 [Rhodoferax sp.]|uniref:hypothetical protein n=1 Tax=Rhodoferax sp. TaxID=50421 RepID=UPI00326491F3
MIESLYMEPMQIENALLLAATAAIFTYPITLAIGAPLFLLLNHFSIRAYLAYASGGVAIGIATALMLEGYTYIRPEFFIACSLVGFFSITAFWLINFWQGLNVQNVNRLLDFLCIQKEVN